MPAWETRLAEHAPLRSVRAAQEKHGAVVDGSPPETEEEVQDRRARLALDKSVPGVACDDDGNGGGDIGRLRRG